MKNFVINLVENKKLQRKNINGVRHYVIDGNEVAYPSVTTVLSSDQEKKKSLMEWRRRVGEDEANKISRQAASRGSVVHGMIEDYLQGTDPLLEYSAGDNDDRIMPFHKSMFHELRKVADEHIDNIRAIEGQMYSNYLRVAGTVDLVAEYDGKLSIIDWKTSKRLKSKDHITNYFMQESAYAVMFEELYNLPVAQLVTIIVTEDYECQVFIEKRDDWIGDFIRIRNEYDAQLQNMSQTN